MLYEPNTKILLFNYFAHNDIWNPLKQEQEDQLFIMLYEPNTNKRIQRIKCHRHLFNNLC